MSAEAIKGDILDFVWIEKYRNIKKQGFSFSTKYHYTYDEKKNILTRTLNNSFIDNFFDNSIEINAVVGENGTGKTSLLRAVFEAVHHLYYDETAIKTTTDGKPKDLEDLPKIILAFRDGTVYCFYANLAWRESVIKATDNKYMCNLMEVAINNYRKGEQPQRQRFNLPFFYHSSTLDYGAFSRFEVLDSYTEYKLSNQTTINGTLHAHDTDSIPLSHYDLSTSAFLSEKNLSGHNRLVKNSVYEFFHEEVFKQIDLIVSHNIVSKEKFKALFGFGLPEVLTANVISDNQITSLFNGFLVPPTDEITNIINSPQVQGKKISEIEANPKYKEVIQKIIGDIQIGRSHWLDYSVETLKALYNTDFLLKKLKRNPSDTQLKESLEWGLLVCAILLYSYHPSIPLQYQRFNMRDLYMELCDTRDDNNLSAWEQLKNYIQILDSSPIIKSMPAETDKLEEWNKRKDALNSFIDLIENESNLTENKLPRIDICKDNSIIHLKADLVLFFQYYREFCTIIDFLKFSWPLSSGEEAKFALFARINSALKHQAGEYVYLLFDEADMLLHPRWQQNFIKALIDYMKEYFIPHRIKNVQIIIATHSPIMLSDVPEQNTLLLSAEPDYCQRETFAANIFSLFRNSFFLNDSGMGDFAFDKIDWIINQIHDCRADKDKVLQYICTVGDPYLKEKLMQEYHSELAESDELSRMKIQKAMLEAKIAKLESEDNS